jgi:hypothetical protein
MSDREPSVWGEATAADSGPITVGSTDPTEEQRAYWEQQGRLGEQIEANKQHLTTLVEHAQQAGHVLYATLPNLDSAGVQSLSGELQLIAIEAARAGDGLENGSAAHHGFAAAGHWAGQAASTCGSLTDLGDQEQHAAVSDLLHALDNMHASLAGI